MKKPEDYALLWANGMSFGDVIRLHTHDLAEHLRNHPDNEGKFDFAFSYAADAIEETV